MMGDRVMGQPLPSCRAVRVSAPCPPRIVCLLTFLSMVYQDNPSQPKRGVSVIPVPPSLAPCRATRRQAFPRYRLGENNKGESESHRQVKPPS